LQSKNLHLKLNLMKPVRIFFSYAHKDERFKERLVKQLSFLKRNKKVIGWHDRLIFPGSAWEKEINDNIDGAQVILMLISPDFIDSDYCYLVESVRAFEKRERQEAVIMPIIIHPCVWEQTPFGQIQALPKNGKAISTFSNRDVGWLEVAKGVSLVIDELLQKTTTAPVTAPVTNGASNGASPPALTKACEEQLVGILSSHKPLWFHPGKIKSLAAQMQGNAELSALDVVTLTNHCESLATRGVLKKGTNVKGSQIFKVNETH
jgi:hypothetical protein